MKFKQKSLCVCLSLLLALGFALYVIGPENIDPTRTDHVLYGGGDNLQHYLGWRFYRGCENVRALFFMQNLNYPAGTSVIVTDSNPLFCLIFKAFSRFLPESFQFNGIWLLCSWMLTALFAALIGWKLTGSIFPTLAGSLFAILNPVILQRALIHDTLTAHWLILAAILLLLNRKEKWNCIGWALLVLTSMLIHAYFLPMIGFVLGLQLILGLYRKDSLKELFLPCAGFVTAFILGYVGFGYRFIQSRSGSFGELSLNLNAFFNPDGWGLFLKDRPTFPFQYEGFNYFGLGLLLLCAAAAVCAEKADRRTCAVLLIPCLLLIGFAASNVGAFDRTVIWQAELPEGLSDRLSVFRSSGRLVWPLYYLALFTALRALSGKKKWGRLLLGICLVLQAADFTPAVISTAERFRNPSNDIGELPANFSDHIPDGVTKIFVPEDAPDIYAVYAAEHGLSYNRSTDARGIRPIFGRDPVDLRSLRRDDLEPDAVYLFFSSGPYDALLSDCADITREYAGILFVSLMYGYEE